MGSAIERIAKEAGVSKTLVSLVINNKYASHRISPETVSKVKDVIARTGFIPSHQAKSLRLGSTQTIGLVVGDVTNHFFSMIEESVEKEARKHNFRVIIASSNDDPETEKETVGNLLSRSVDGLIIASVHQQSGDLDGINPQKRPMVFIDRLVSGKKAVNVTSDNATATRQLINRWIQLKYRNIAFIGGNPLFRTHSERLLGFEQALKDNRLAKKPELIFEGAFTPSSGYKSMQKLTESGILPDAVFTASFTLFEGVLEYLKKQDRATIKLGTFDNHPFMDFIRWPVDSISQDCQSMGREAFSILTDLMQGKKPANKHIIVPTKAVYRN